MRMSADYSEAIIEERKRKGLDLYDEVWDGVYVMPTVPTMAHQKLVKNLCVIIDLVVTETGKGDVVPGANITDRRTNWTQNFRVPDVVVLLNNSRAIDHETHVFGGPNFLVE